MLIGLVLVEKAFQYRNKRFKKSYNPENFMLKPLILIHTILEIVGGVVLVFNPEFLMFSQDMNLQTTVIIKLFGVAVLGIGLLSLLGYKRFSYTVWDIKFVVVLMSYHFIQAIQSYSMTQQGIFSNYGAFVVHMILGPLIMIGFMKERNLFEDIASS